MFEYILGHVADVLQIYHILFVLSLLCKTENFA